MRVKAVNRISIACVALSEFIVSMIFMQMANAPRAIPIDINAAPIDLHFALFAKFANESAISLKIPVTLFKSFRDLTIMTNVKILLARSTMLFTDILSEPVRNSMKVSNTPFQLLKAA